jgi:hypothetical protein
LLQNRHRLRCGPRASGIRGEEDRFDDPERVIWFVRQTVVEGRESKRQPKFGDGFVDLVQRDEPGLVIDRAPVLGADELN